MSIPLFVFVIRLFFAGRRHPVADVVNDRAAEDALVLGPKPTDGWGVEIPSGKSA